MHLPGLHIFWWYFSEEAVYPVGCKTRPQLPKSNHTGAKEYHLGNIYFINIISFINQCIFFVKGDMKLLTCFIFHRPILINMNFVTPVKFFIKSPATDIYFFYLLLTLLRYYQNFVLCWVFFPILWSFPNNSTHMMYSFSSFFFFNILLKYAVMGSIYSPSYSDIICPFSRYWAIIFWRHHCMTPFCLNYGEICV